MNDTTRQSVPPNPETILEGLSSLKFGNSAPSATASPHKVALITAIEQAKKRTRSGGRCSIRLDAVMSVTVTHIEAAQLSQNFCSSTLPRPMGARPMIQSRRPSSENCGKTKRVVSVESVSEEAARFRYEIMVSQNSLRKSNATFRKFST